MTIGFDLHELEILENAGSEEICIGTSEDTTYLHHGLSLEVIIPLAYEKGNLLCVKNQWHSKDRMVELAYTLKC